MKTTKKTHVHTSEKTPSNARPCCADGCCAPAPSVPPAPAPVDAEAVRATVRAGYSAIAREGGWAQAHPVASAAPSSCGCGAGGCCGPSTFSPAQLAEAIGYASDDLDAVPDGANMGLSCGNPTALAELRPGETVLDLGAGGGFDCFIAGRRVGASGRVIGVDMTADMVAKARANTRIYRETSRLDNVEFRLGEIENLPVPDASVDVVISNCVLNLSPDQPRVWREIARVLRPGGRVAISDLALLRPLPESIRADAEALVGCIAGAPLVEQVHAMAAGTGLTDIDLRPSSTYIQAMERFDDPLYRKVAAGLGPNARLSDWVTSLEVRATRR